LSPPAHKKRERGVRSQGGKHQKKKCKSKLETKAEKYIVMTKRSCSHEKEGEELRGLVHLKKKAMAMKKVATTIVTLVFYKHDLVSWLSFCILTLGE